jgi:hypothetical protein
MVLRRREVLVQLDDELVERLDRLAAERGTNRCELLRLGAAAVIDASELAAADRQLEESYRRIPQDLAAATRWSVPGLRPERATPSSQC